MVFYPFGEWKPDDGRIGPETLKRAHQVYASGSTYTPLRKMVPSTPPLPGRAQGAASFIDRNGTIVTVAGDETGLYVSRGSSWENISKDGGYNAVGQVWRFAMWGDYILATDFNDPIQAWHMGSVGKFEDMSDSAPRCKDMAIVNEFLVLVNTIDRYDGERPNRIWWSPLADPFGEWLPSSATLCDYQDIQVGSFCVGIIGGAYGTVMMRNAIVRMTFIGSPMAFSIETVERDKGCVGIEAFCADGDDVYFVAQDGFYMWNGSQSVPLSTGKVEQWYFDNAEQASGNLVICAFDRVKKIVLFGYPAKGEYNAPNKMLIFGILAGRWTEADCSVAHFSQFLSKGYDLEELDELSLSVDNLPFGLDSNYYKGGLPSIAGLGADGIMYLESADSLAGTLVTGDFPVSGTDGQLAYTQRVRPVLEGGEGHTMSLSSKQSLFDADDYGRICALSRLGDFTERQSGRYHSFRFDFRGDWARAKGFDVIFATGELQ